MPNTDKDSARQSNAISRIPSKWRELWAGIRSLGAFGIFLYWFIVLIGVGVLFGIGSLAAMHWVHDSAQEGERIQVPIDVVDLTAQTTRDWLWQEWALIFLVSALLGALLVCALLLTRHEVQSARAQESLDTRNKDLATKISERDAAIDRQDLAIADLRSTLPSSEAAKTVAYLERIPCQFPGLERPTTAAFFLAHGHKFSGDGCSLWALSGMWAGIPAEIMNPERTAPMRNPKATEFFAQMDEPIKALIAMDVLVPKGEPRDGFEFARVFAHGPKARGLLLAMSAERAA